MRDATPTSNTPGASPAGKSLGMGGEATEAMHALEQQAGGGAPPDPHAASQQNAAATGRGGGEDAGDTDRAGSEPLGRQREHVPSYGGMGGVPRTSSDQREPADPEGDANVGGGQGGPPPTSSASPPPPAHGQPGGQADESDPPYPTPT
jgi:hypothetical protein